MEKVAVLKCSPIWKKMRKSFKTLSELKLKFIPKVWKQVPPPLKIWMDL